MNLQAIKNFFHRSGNKTIHNVPVKELNAIGEQLSKQFTYSQLKNERPECVGALKELTDDLCDDFLENYIFEIACKKLKQNWIPEVVRQIDPDLLKNYFKIPVELMDEVFLDDYPLQPFKKAIILSPTKSIESALKIIKNDKIVYEGYELNATRAIGDTILLGWILPNVPFILIAYSPQIAQPLCEIKKHVENAADAFKDVYTRYIFEQNEQLNNYKYMLVEKEAELQVETRRAENYKADKEFLLQTAELVAGEEDPNMVKLAKPLYYILWIFTFLSLIFGALLLGNSANPGVNG